MTRHQFTWGGHNLHDQAGVPTMFADAVIFTEAIPHTVQDELGRPTVKQRAKKALAHARLRATGHAVIICRQQPDLIWVGRRRLFKVKGRTYERFVDGRAKVTPNRGTFTVLAEHRPTGKMLAFVGEHRINAAFNPWIRGERLFRMDAWDDHTNGTWGIIRRLIHSDYVVCAGGDVNTPHGIPAYPISLHERGEGLDRLAATRPMGQATYLGRVGSDHPRIKATVHL